MNFMLLRGGPNSQQIVSYLDSYFLKDPKGRKQEVQKGVVRTNCVDCLDRTNVTQVNIFSAILSAMY